MPRLFLPFVALLAVLAAAPAAELSPAAVFEQRLLPIFKSPNPSSCVQCHLAGVDLKDYILPDHEKTFRSLRDQGLIDLDAPEKSRILVLIQMGAADPKAPQVRAAARLAEYEAFAAWIKASAADPELRTAPPLAPAERAKPAAPDAVIRHARADRLLDSFERNVWGWRFRCMNCHTEGTPQGEKNRKQYGDRVAWAKSTGAAATMDALLAGRLVDFDRPENSPLLRKPLGLDDHGGGVKFAPGDQAHKGFRTWIEDVAAVRAGKYKSAADLPPADRGTLRFGTDVWLKLADTSPAWADKLLRADVHAWDPATKAWEPAPIATTDRVVWGKGRLWQHSLVLLAAPGSTRAKAWAAGKPMLPPGRYQVRVFVDRDGKLAKDWTADLGAADAVGRAEFDAKWAEGYGKLTVVPASAVRP